MTFDFESRGLERRGDIYPGTFELKNDTIIFNYTDSIPKVGDKAILTEKYIPYFGGKVCGTIGNKEKRVENELKKLVQH